MKRIFSKSVVCAAEKLRFFCLRKAARLTAIMLALCLALLPAVNVTAAWAYEGAGGRACEIKDTDPAGLNGMAADVEGTEAAADHALLCNVEINDDGAAWTANQICQYSTDADAESAKLYEINQETDVCGSDDITQNGGIEEASQSDDAGISQPGDGDTEGISQPDGDTGNEELYDGVTDGDIEDTTQTVGTPEEAYDAAIKDAELTDDAEKEPEPEEALGIESIQEVTPESVYDEMCRYFESLSCKNTSLTDVTTFWSMLAMRELGMPANTRSQYQKAEYDNLTVLNLCKFIIAMVNDGVRPEEYTITDKNGTVMDPVELLQSYCDSETGEFKKPGSTSAEINVQIYALFTLGICDIDADQKTADFFGAHQDDDGILLSSWMGKTQKDMDQTAWAISACELSGLVYPKKAAALEYMFGHTGDMNANTYACYLDCLSAVGELSQENIRDFINREDIYNPATGRFLYNKKDNLSACQQASIAVGEYISDGNIWKDLDAEYTYSGEHSVSEKTVRVRVSVHDVKSQTDTDTLVDKELYVGSGSWQSVRGISKTSSSVTALDAMVEAAYFSIYGKDPTVHDLEDTYVRQAVCELLGESVFTKGSTGYNAGAGTWGYASGDWIYVKDGLTPVSHLLTALTAGEHIDFIHYDASAASFAFFAKTGYSIEKGKKASVSVKQFTGFNQNGKIQSKGIPAKITVFNGDTQVTEITAAASGSASVSGLEAGEYRLTASYSPGEGKYVFGAEAALTVTASKPVSDKTVSVTVRVADCVDGDNTKDLVARRALSVTNGSWETVQGITKTSAEVTCGDAYVEAAYYFLYGEDPVQDDLRAATVRAAVKGLLKESTLTSGWIASDAWVKGGEGIDAEHTGYDCSWAYYINGTTAAGGMSDPLSAGDDIFFYHYNWQKTNHAAFDRAYYTMAAGGNVSVTVNAVAGWNNESISGGIPATVIVSQGGSEVQRAVADPQGRALISGLSAGRYKLTARYSYGNGSYIVEPYAELIVVNTSNVTVLVPYEVDMDTEGLLAACMKDMTQEEWDGYRSGSRLTLRISIRNITGSIDQTEKNRIDAGITQGTVDEYFEITVVRHVGGTAATVLHDTAIPIKYRHRLSANASAVPQGMTRSYNVFRLHGDEVTELPATQQGAEIIFESDKYSVFALAYSDSANNQDQDRDQDQNQDQNQDQDRDKDHGQNQDQNQNQSGTGSSGSYGSAVYIPLTAEGKVSVDSTGAVSGTWIKNTVNGTWMFTAEDGTQPKAQWKLILLNDGKGKAAWYYFDTAGAMLTGWQKITGQDGLIRYYYLSTEKGLYEGACYIDSITPDGYTVDKSGAWTIGGVRQIVNAGQTSQDSDILEDDSSKNADTEADNSGTGTSGTGTSGTGASGTDASGSSKDSVTDEASEKDVKLRVTVSIVTSAAGSPFSGSGKYTVEEGSTVFDVLGLLCEDNDWNIDGDGNYVSGVNGLCEFDHGSSSGWMYKVNGRYPGVSCGDYVLSDGDKVVWVYVTSIQNIDGQ